MNHWSGDARKSRRNAKFGRFVSTVLLVLAVFFLVAFLVLGALGTWAWMMLPSIMVIASSAFTIRMSSRSLDDSAQTFERLSR